MVHRIQEDKVLLQSLVNKDYADLPIDSAKVVEWECNAPTSDVNKRSEVSEKVGGCGGVWKESVKKRGRYTRCPKCEPAKGRTAKVRYTYSQPETQNVVNIKEGQITNVPKLIPRTCLSPRSPMAQTADITVDMSKPPTNYSNWVICNSETGSCILQGSYPYTDAKKKKNQLDILMQLNMRVYVNLCRQHEINRFGDYERMVTDYNKEHGLQTPTFYKCPIQDGSVTSDEMLDDIVDTIVREFQLPNTRIFVHCKGGHGRSSTIDSCVLMKLANRYDAEWALSVIGERYKTRVVKYNVPAPNRPKQIAQVRRYAQRHGSE